MKPHLVFLVAFFFSTILRAEVTFDTIDLETISKKVLEHGSYTQTLSQDAWVITLYGTLLPFASSDIKNAILDPKNRASFYMVDPQKYWVHTLQHHVSETSLDISTIFLTETAGNEIADCNLGTCNVKLHPTEIEVLLKKPTAKFQTYIGLVKKRISDFKSNHKFRGYDRDENTPIYQAMLQSFPITTNADFLKNIFHHGSFYYEHIDFLKDSFGKPVLKIYWQSSWQEKDVYYVFSFDIYNNHFFDSGMTAMILKPIDEHRTIYLSYFNYEVDELKKGFWVSLLFKDKFYRYQLLVQEAFVTKLRDWLSQQNISISPTQK